MRVGAGCGVQCEVRVGLNVLESVTEDVERVCSPREGSDSVRVQGFERLVVQVGGTDSGDQCKGSSVYEMKYIPGNLQEGRDGLEGEGAEAGDSSKEVDRGLTLEETPEGAEAPGEND